MEGVDEWNAILQKYIYRRTTFSCVHIKRITLHQAARQSFVLCKQLGMNLDVITYLNLKYLISAEGPNIVGMFLVATVLCM